MFNSPAFATGRAKEVVPWQQFVPLVIVLGVAMILVWRSSGKKANCGCGGDCAHDHQGEKKKENAAR